MTPNSILCVSIVPRTTARSPVLRQLLGPRRPVQFRRSHQDRPQGPGRRHQPVHPVRSELRHRNGRVLSRGVPHQHVRIHPNDGIRPLRHLVRFLCGGPTLNVLKSDGRDDDNLLNPLPFHPVHFPPATRTWLVPPRVPRDSATRSILPVTLPIRARLAVSFIACDQMSKY